MTFSRPLLGTDTKKTKLSWFEYVIFSCLKQGWYNCWYSFQNWKDLVLNNYQELLKGVAVADTAYVLNAAKTLIQLTDSFPAAAITFKDSLLKEQAKQSLNNINAELQGLIAEQSLPALHLATHMVSIQFLNLLASVGYHQKNIYIYNVQDEKLEDGMIWFGWYKTSKDPYHPNRKEEIKAQQLLQE